MGRFGRTIADPLVGEFSGHASLFSNGDHPKLRIAVLKEVVPEALRRASARDSEPRSGPGGVTLRYYAKCYVNKRERNEGRRLTQTTSCNDQDCGRMRKESIDLGIPRIDL